MTEPLHLVLVFFVGAILGMLFFGGLWLTVKKITTSKAPAVLFLGSSIIRVGITLFGFYYFALDNWKTMLVCLLGFIIARIVVTHFTKANEENLINLKRENDL